MSHLRVIEPEPAGADIIPMLEEALDRARRGELSSAAVLMVYKDGATGQLWSELPATVTMIGCAQRLVHKLNLELDA